MISPDEMNALAALLRDQPTPTPLIAERQHALLLIGILAELEAAALAASSQALSPDPVDLLRETAALQPDEAVRAQALQILLRLAQNGAGAAVDALYRLAIEEQNLAARQAILTRGWKPERPGLLALFDWFSRLETGAAYPEESLPLLTQAYFEMATPSVQHRLHATAAQTHAETWSRILQAAQSGSEEGLFDLVERYPSFRPTERAITLEQFERLAAQGSPAARSALGLLFIRYEDQRARDAIIQYGYLPEDLEQRALFLFLSEQWAAYEVLDFDHNLLTNAYETAGRSLRRRLLEHSRHTGQMDWMRGLSISGTTRWLNDLTDADWDLSIQRLTESTNYTGLWRLAQVAPPVWSAAILERLDQQSWRPEKDDDQAGFALLVRLAHACKSAPLTIQPRKNLHAPTLDFTCLAMHPNGRILAAGCSDQRIFQWNLPDGDLREPELGGPAPVTRAMIYSPDGELLTAASGDNRIRPYRLSNGQILKTLEGHRAMIRALAIHPDGRTLYSAGFDGTIRFWRFPYGPDIKTIHPGPHEIFGITLAAGGRALISAGADSLVRVWNLPDGAAARELDMHTDTITHLAANPASELVASAGRDGMLHVWNATSGGLVRSIAIAGSPITALAISPSEQVLLGGRSNGEIMLWSLSTGRVIDRLKAHSQTITGLALTPSGDALYSADAGGHLQVWDLRAFLAARLPGESAHPGVLEALQDRLKQPGIPSAEKAWLSFIVELARWRQRFDIELAEITTIPIGEFDIEL